jgi:hypothetical protein
MRERGLKPKQTDQYGVAVVSLPMRERGLNGLTNYLTAGCS